MANTAGYCAHCAETAIMTCYHCRDIRYCSVECLEADEHTHSVLCGQLASFRQRPNPLMRRAILLPERDTMPRFVWIPVIDKVQDQTPSDDGGNEQVDFDKRFGVPSSDRYGKSETLLDLNQAPELGRHMVDILPLVIGAQGFGQHLDHSIHALIRDMYEIPGDVAKENECIKFLTRGKSGSVFKGPIILFAMSKVVSSITALDLSASDLSVALEAMLDLKEKQERNINFLLRQKAPATLVKAPKKTKGVMVTASEPHFQEIDVPLDHPAFSEAEESQISRHVGLSIRTHISLTMLRPLWAFSTGNPATYLQTIIEADASKGFEVEDLGTVENEWVDNAKSVLLVRSDQRPLKSSVALSMCRLARDHCMQLQHMSLELRYQRAPTSLKERWTSILLTMVEDQDDQLSQKDSVLVRKESELATKCSELARNAEVMIERDRALAKLNGEVQELTRKVSMMELKRQA